MEGEKIGSNIKTISEYDLLVKKHEVAISNIDVNHILIEIELSSGPYFIRVTYNSGISETRKFVVP